MGNTHAYARSPQQAGQPGLPQSAVGTQPSGPKPNPKFGAVVGMIIVALLLAPFILVGGSVLNVNRVAGIHSTTPTDAIVVMGAAQYDGTPSPVFENRLNHAKQLYNQGVSTRIITVGGKQPSDRYTEAQAGREWLIRNGVDPMRVLSVRSGSDSLSSLTAVGEVAKERGWKSITIVSDPTHLARSAAMATRVGFDVQTNATTDGDGSKVTENYLMRETLAYLAFELFGQWEVPRLVNVD